MHQLPNKYPIGTRVIIIKPDEPACPPGWVNYMDIFDRTVGIVTGYSPTGYAIVRSDEHSIGNVFTYNIDWLIPATDLSVELYG